ncbi:hypothetical protein PHLCEN_2v6226 [Hermanssonia centrifuga]|uniref:Uncharacterized protein n=1 Tax=Hermanssonia centrifuga TaxID=98765 RepID=A0A2R6NZY7_9APHY|nr:hypothetical protein PHLCEN_2v6226 [Hermanssonia centrifuga]
MQRDGGNDNAPAFPSPTAGPSAQPAHGGIFVSPSSAPQRFHNPLTGSPSEFDFIPQAPNFPASTSLANYMDQVRSVPSSYASSIYSDTTDNFPPTRGDSLTSFAQDALEVNNQLNALFSTELFDKFFCDAFEESSVHSLDGSQAVYGLNDMLNDGGNQLPYATETVDMQPFMGSMPPPDFDLYNLETNFMSAAAISTGPIPNISPVFPDPTVEPSVIPYPSEFQNYTHLFYTMFLAQIPIMHVPTFTIDGKPQILISAMQACGALYVRTQAAAKFIEQTLASARDQLVGEFVSGTGFPIMPPQIYA